jgi:hypothetical protein
VVERSLSDEALLSGLFAVQVASEIAAEDEVRRSAEEASRDHLAERLVADGIFPNLYQVEHDGSIATWRTQVEYPYPWKLPSRLFRFPAQTYRGPDGTRRIGVLHPLLLEHPVIQELIAKGYELSSAEECVNEHGVSANFIHHGTWWHAVDLIQSHPRELVATRRFTTDADIAGAVRYRCSYPHDKGPLTRLLAEMREVMAALGTPEPTGGSVTVLATFDEPMALHGDGSGKKSKPRWPINTSRALRSEEGSLLAWAYIHGIEGGWFQNHGGYLHWSEKGRSCWAELNPDRQQI